MPKTQTDRSESYAITFLQFLVFVDLDLCRVKVQLVVDGEPLDQRDVRLLALALADLALLDQPVEPQPHGRIGHAVYARDLLERTGSKDKLLDKRHVLIVELGHPLGYDFYRHAITSFLLSLV